jgi:hypothetical protein
MSYSDFFIILFLNITFLFIWFNTTFVYEYCKLFGFSNLFKEYEKENGSFGYSYYSELDKKDEYIIVEMCEMNNYLFNLHGEPIHHLIKG